MRCITAVSAQRTCAGVTPAGSSSYQAMSASGCMVAMR